MHTTIAEAWIDVDEDGLYDPEEKPLEGVVFHAEWYEFKKWPSCFLPAGGGLSPWQFARLGSHFKQRTWDSSQAFTPAQVRGMRHAPAYKPWQFPI